MEANDDPFTVQDRFEKHVIDTVFDATRAHLIGQNINLDQKSSSKQRNSTSQELEVSSKGGLIWARIAYQLARYFTAIKQNQNASQLYQKACSLTDDPKLR